eukprot:2439858-Alexandrium_andersonii.AAC.1
MIAVSEKPPGRAEPFNARRSRSDAAVATWIGRASARNCNTCKPSDHAQTKRQPRPARPSQDTRARAPVC